MALYKEWCDTTKEKEDRKHYWSFVEKAEGRERLQRYHVRCIFPLDGIINSKSELSGVASSAVDSRGSFSEQIDVVIFDRQYTPFIFKYNDQTIIPAEGVYGVFEAKQEITAHEVEYAKKKVASVRKLHRTSLPIPYAQGMYDPKPLIPILGGILTFESSWSPPLGQPLLSALSEDVEHGALDFGCVAAAGYFARLTDGSYDIQAGGKPATAFLFKLIAQLQFSGTVPMIDVGAYAAWLAR